MRNASTVDDTGTRPRRSSRRELLRGGVVAGGLALVTGPAALAAPPEGLSAAARRRYAALVEAVGSVPGTLVEPGRRREAAASLGRHYAEASEVERRRIDAALAVVETPGLRPFAARSVERRVDLLLDLLERDAGAGGASSLESRVTDVIALAAAPFHPGGFRWRPATAALWIRAARACRTQRASSRAA